MASAAQDRGRAQNNQVEDADSEHKQGQLVLADDDEEDLDRSLSRRLRRVKSVQDLGAEASCSQRCSECGSQCASGCSQCCSSYRDVVKKNWKKFDAKMRWISNQVWPGPLGVALNMSTTVSKRIDVFMWQYNDQDDPDHYYYPEFKKHYLPGIKIGLIVVGGGLGTYILCKNKSKQMLKGMLRGLPAGCALTLILEQACFNEIWRDKKNIPDEYFYPSIFLVSLGAGVVAAYRSGRGIANQVVILSFTTNSTFPWVKLKQINRVSCGDRGLWALDVITRGLFYASTLSIPALLRFDQEYPDDGNLAFQRTWEYAAIGGVAVSLGQSFILDPATPSGPYVEMAALSAFCYEIVQQLMETDDSNQMTAEIVLWAVITAISLYMMRMRRNLELAQAQHQQYRALPEADDAPAPIVRSRTNPYAGQDSKGHFARGGGVVSDPSRAAMRMTVPTPAEIRQAITLPM